MISPRPVGLFDLHGKVALITGSTRGIGLSIAEELAIAGAQVVISSNERARCEEVAAEFRRSGRDAVGIPCDVSSNADLQELVSQAIHMYGRIDVLVCNAGIAPHMGPIATASDDDWESTLAVNLRSLLWLTSLVIPGMAERRDGAVIVISSIAGLRGNKSIGIYGISKAAGAQLVRNLAVEWGPCNIRVNAISPGVIRTDFAQPLLSNSQFMARRIALTPLRRVGEPLEVAALAVLLASRGGAFITGQNLVVDGGTLIGDGG